MTSKSLNNNHQIGKPRRKRSRWSSPIPLFLFASLITELCIPENGSSVTAFQAARPSHSIAVSQVSSPTRNEVAGLVFAEKQSRCLSTQLFDSEITEAEIDLPTSLNPRDDGRINGDVTGKSLNAALGSSNGAMNGAEVVNGQPHLSNGVNGLIQKEQTSILDMPLPTNNGGYTHTKASKAKISAANKGKTPWNKGRERSPETKARIAAGVRAKNRERFLKKLEEDGITEEEYNERKKAERRKKDAERRARMTENGGFRPSDETKQKISEILKAKWANGEMPQRRVDPSKVRRGFTHSEETRAKISASLRDRWANDANYRESMVNKTAAVNTNTHTRQKISETLKTKWQDPEFRNMMISKMQTRRQSTHARDDNYRRKISEAMKAKWQSTEYREKTTESIRKRAKEMAKLRPPKPIKKPKARPTKVSGRVQLAQVAKPVLPRAPRKKKPLEVDENGDRIPPAKVKKVVKKKVVKKVVQKAPVLANGNDSVPKKVKKEPDGSINRLRDERRDLYDLLYGDEDSSQDEPTSGIAAMLDLEDENLDTFDPYGLEDH